MRKARRVDEPMLGFSEAPRVLNALSDSPSCVVAGGGTAAYLWTAPQIAYRLGCFLAAHEDAMSDAVESAEKGEFGKLTHLRNAQSGAT